MGDTIHKLYLLKATPAWFGLSRIQQEERFAKVRPLLGKVGARSLLICNSGWANERWDVFGVEEFPSLVAEQEHSRLLQRVNWPNPFFESFSLLGARGDLNVAEEDIANLIHG